MATISTKPDIDISNPRAGVGVPAWPKEPGDDSGLSEGPAGRGSAQKPSQHDALQALLAFSALHDQIRHRKALASRKTPFDSPTLLPEFEPGELFVLDEVLQLVAERAVAI